MRPFVGITLDYQETKTYSTFPWYALRKNYVDVCLTSGCLPLPLPYTSQFLARYLERLSGVIISGGNFDVDPALFGEMRIHPKTQVCPNRTAFELALVREALLLKMPILGICGGAQLLNVALGGTLIQDIPTEVNSPLAHAQPNPTSEGGHLISVKEGTQLARITGMREIPVNSAHHQAVKKVGAGLVVSAVASDGVVEAIELAGHPFCLGIQWNPEFLVSKADEKLFHAFAEACVAFREKDL